MSVGRTLFNRPKRIAAAQRRANCGEIVGMMDGTGLEKPEKDPGIELMPGGGIGLNCRGGINDKAA
jgi:hypothetical protein